MSLFFYNPMASLREFHRKFKVQNFTQAETPGQREIIKAVRCSLIMEEAQEVVNAINDGSLEEVAKELADLLYVTYGTAEVLNIPLPAVFQEVHRSNMTKLGEDGEPIFREDGKVLKGKNYRPADIASIIKG